MPRPSRPTVVHVRTNLGLVPGVERLGEVLLEGGLAGALGAAVGPVVESPPYSPERSHPSRLLNAEGLVDVALREADSVGAVIDDGSFPIVLGGDDSTLFGSLLALRRRGRYGLVFLDGHIDYYPPDASPTGEASDSDLYLAMGNGPDLISDLEGRQPLVDPAATAAIGHRDLDEQADTGDALRATAALVISLDEVREAGPEATAQRALAHLDDAEVDGFLIHVDADVLDDALMPAVDYRIAGGLSTDEFATLVGTLLADDHAAALDVTIYNPDLDPDRTAQRNLIECLTGAFDRADAADPAG